MDDTTNALAWDVLYERAITQPDVNLRRQRLAEAETAILERARVLDEEPGQHEAEGQALEEAADFIREMKLQTQSDGVGKELRVGQKRSLRPRPPLRDAGSTPDMDGDES
jgi:hypothetical protein